MPRSWGREERKGLRPLLPVLLQYTMRVVQGGVIGSSFFLIAVGVLGLMTQLMRCVLGALCALRMLLQPGRSGRQLLPLPAVRALGLP